VGRILEPEFQALADQWSPVVYDLLHDLGRQVWPPIKVRHMLVRVKVVPRYLVEGPVQRGDSLAWALSHTINPSSFDEQGRLTKGERACWIVTLHAGQPPTFSIEGRQVSAGIPADHDALAQALRQAGQSAPQLETFYGNKGPLTQRQK
jgi:hypothetical protein